MFVKLYGGKMNDRLNELRSSRYINMAVKSSKIRPEAFPPIERAALSMLASLLPTSRLEHFT